MGLITVQIRGSFGNKPDATFLAVDGGHALAITRAIRCLAEELPKAIQLDHQLARDGQKPPNSDFGQVPARPGVDDPR